MLALMVIYLGQNMRVPQMHWSLEITKFSQLTSALQYLTKCFRKSD